jgi:AcrR family transcriptional regulator
MGMPESVAINETANSPRPRGRPRDQARDETILRAARILLAREGYDGLSFEAISQMTGISRPTIYRRWPTKAHLANDVAATTGPGSFPDIIATRGIKAQIRALVEQLYATYACAEIAAASVGLITQYQRTPGLRGELHDPLEKATRRQFAVLLDKGKALGLVRDDVGPDTLFDILVGTIVFRLMFATLRATPAIIDEITDIVVRGIAKS